MYRKALLGLFFVVVLGVLCTKSSFAASLNGISDTVTTSRPSASAPLGADQAASAGQATIVDNNSVFLQGDSATFWADPVGGGEITDNGILVASMSAANTPTSGKRIVYFSNTVPDKHHQGDALVVPITAMHTISFKPITNIPSGGKVVITFPTTATADTNQASPSAQTFMLNGLTNSQIQVNGISCSSITVTAGSAGTTPSITCTTNALVSGGTTVTFLIGCSAATGAACTTQVPRLINPMKNPTNVQSGSGVGTTQADNLKVTVQTQDTPGNGGGILDSGTAVVGIIESVQVQGTIDPTLTFQVTGITNGTNVSTSHGSGCPSQSTNSGFDTNATFVNLGTIGTGINIAAQDLTVSTNGQGGYVLTATASGQLANSQNTYSINSSTTPGFMTAGTELFGIHPCGTDVNTATWGTGTIGGGANAKVAWPTPTTSIALASRSSVANAILTTVMYAITASAISPAGLYTSVITYVATPSFN